MRSLFLVALLVLNASLCRAQTWRVETVPTENITGRSSIVVENYVPHIAATNWYDGRFFYYSRGDAGWTREQLPLSGSVGSGRAMRLDASGFARILVEGQMAVQSAAGWSVVSVPASYNWWQAMAIDPAGTSHVSYVWSVGSGQYTGGFSYEWEDLAPNVFLPDSPSCEMEYDANGNLSIVAMLNLPQPIMLWQKSPHGWLSENIGVGAWPSMAFDNEGRLHVCYYGYPSHTLLHAVRNAPGNWSTTTIDNSGDVGRDPSLVVGAQGHLNVSYYDAINADLKFARSGDGGATWSVTTVESAGNVGEYSSMVANEMAVYISYFERITAHEGKLHYARLTGSLTGVDRTPATRSVSIRAVPNPFNPATTIEFTLPARERVRVGIYDVSGRLVERLVDEERAAGSHRVRYSARSASGVYFARIETAGTTASTKIIVLK